MSTKTVTDLYREWITYYNKSGVKITKEEIHKAYINTIDGIDTPEYIQYNTKSSLRATDK